MTRPQRRTALHTVVATQLQTVGQRYTDNRRQVVDVLAVSERPLSIPEVMAQARGLAQSSVYRSLAVLEQAGVAHRVQGVDEFSRYELAEDLTEHHHHLVCRHCGSVADVTSPPRVERTLTRAAAAVADALGFEADSHRFDLVGRCADCK